MAVNLPVPPTGPGELGAMPGMPAPDVAGLAALLGMAPRPEDVILEKLRPAMAMANQLAEYVAGNPELAPFVKAYLNMVVGPRGRRAGAPQGTSGLVASPALTPPALPTGPGPTLPGFPRPPVMGG
jgi:hypothetical protein